MLILIIPSSLSVHSLRYAEQANKSLETVALYKVFYQPSGLFFLVVVGCCK